ncbi:2465_t:CDS:2 [Diversispora eburnea]|uniref:2465_t:CDS:1 n=1 Tax=Diversispora eburnea TaxID=1213867 RepID=A0A9N9C3S9_9GLOM|nr:2465_t:CDS:2 [Diversispora eburnea]
MKQTISKRKVPESLKKFHEGTQESIIRWYKITKTNNIDLKEDDDFYLNPMLLIIKWNDIGMRQRNIQKDNVINVIQGFNGCQQYPNNITTKFGINIDVLSESIFCINDTHTIGKQQIAENIVALLRQTYFQRHLTSLGKVYEIQATEKGNSPLNKTI